MGLRDNLRGTAIARALREIPAVDRALDRRPPGEPAVQEALRGLVMPGMHVLDVGAHYGSYTKLLSELVGPAGSVTAFEANPETAAGLQRRVRSLHNVTVVNRAVSDKPGPVEMQQWLGDHSATWSLTAEPTGDRDVVRTEAVTLDEHLDAARVDLIKLDIEGAELLALQGATAVLETHPILVIELHGEDMRRDVSALLRTRGYTLADVDESHIKATAP